MPRGDGATADERSLASWFKRKLHLFHSNKLSDEELVKLKEIPAINELVTKSRSFLVRREEMIQHPSLSRSFRFKIKCKSLNEWCATHRALPKRSGRSEEEKSLGIWLMNQLHRSRHGKLSHAQLRRLQMIPALEVFPMDSQSLSKTEDRFHLKCQGFEAWCATHNGTLPRLQGDSPVERSLAAWLKGKILSYRSGKLNDEQLKKLKEISSISELFVLGGTLRWHQFSKFDATCKSLEDWCKAHNGSLPKQKGETPEERRLARWIIKKLYRYRHGMLPEVQLSKLKTISFLSELFHVDC